MNKYLPLFVVILNIALVVPGCNQKPAGSIDSPPPAGKETSGGRLFGVSFQTMNNPFFVELNAGLLEVIEAHEFFGLPSERIAVLVHPESIVHALVSYADGGTLAHLGPPDMRHAIGHALHWPRREKLPLPRLDLARRYRDIGDLSGALAHYRVLAEASAEILPGVITDLEFLNNVYPRTRTLLELLERARDRARRYPG